MIFFYNLLIKDKKILFKKMFVFFGKMLRLVVYVEFRLLFFI